MLTPQEKKEIIEKWHIRSVNMAQEVTDYSKVEDMKEYSDTGDARLVKLRNHREVGFNQGLKSAKAIISKYKEIK